MQSVDDVAKLVASNLDDDAQDSITTAKALPQIRNAYWDLYAQLLDSGYPFGEDDVVLTPVLANATNLDSFAGTGGVLEFMIGGPRVVEWKLVGADDADYLSANKVDKLPDVDSQVGIEAFTMKKRSVRITPSNVDVTARLTIKTLFAELASGDDDTEAELPGGHTIIAYLAAAKLAAIAGQERLADRNQGWANRSISQILVFYSKQGQRIVRRVGRISGRGGRRGRGWPRF